MSSWLQQCIQAFADRDYATSSKLTLPRWGTGLPLESALLVLIAAQRLREPLFQVIREDLIKRTDGWPHWRAFVLAACGELDPAEADIYRTNQRRSCALNYYLGAGLLTKGDSTFAQSFFRLAAEYGEEGQPERILALHEIFSPAPYGLNSGGNVNRLCESTVDLYNRGFYAQAVEKIEAARALAASISSYPRSKYAPLLRIAAQCYTTNRDLNGAHYAYEELLAVSVGEQEEDAASARVGLARLDFAVRDYASAMYYICLFAVSDRLVVLQ